MIFLVVFGLGSAFSYRFKDNPRVNIDSNELPYYRFSWGETLLFYHHGHKRDLGRLDKTFTAYYKEDFGRSKYVYAHTGHLHHVKKAESELMILEQHPTLSPKDAHSARGGYESYRNSKIITYHKNYGEVGRITISPEMIKQ